LQSLDSEEEAFFLPHAAHFSHPPLDFSFLSSFGFSSVVSALQDLPWTESLSYNHIHVSIRDPNESGKRAWPEKVRRLHTGFKEARRLTGERVLEVVEVPETSEPPRNQLVRDTSTFLSLLRAEDMFAAGGGIFVVMARSSVGG